MDIIGILLIAASIVLIAIGYFFGAIGLIAIPIGILLTKSE